MPEEKYYNLQVKLTKEGVITIKNELPFKPHWELMKAFLFKYNKLPFSCIEIYCKEKDLYEAELQCKHVIKRVFDNFKLFLTKVEENLNKMELAECLFLNIHFHDTITNEKTFYKDNYNWISENGSWKYQYLEGNYACDCNRSLFMYNHNPEKEYKCGNKIKITKIENRITKEILWEEGDN